MKLMDEASQLALLWRLVEATDASLLHWESHDESEYSFIAWTSKWAYAIRCRDNDDRAPYYFTIYKVTGAPGDENRATALDTWSTRDHESLFDAVEALYEAAKRKVMGYDSLVADMFADLAEIDGGSPLPPSDEAKPVKNADPWESALGEEPPF